MKRLFSILSVIGILFLGSCEDFSLNAIVVDNQSDYDVTLELYIGSTNDDGSMIFEEFSVSAHEKERIASETNTVYVDTYQCSGSVNMEIDNPGRITFSNN
jgi:hypothetical protein